MPLKQPERFARFHNPHGRPWNGREYITLIQDYMQVPGFREKCHRAAMEIRNLPHTTMADLQLGISERMVKHLQSLFSKYHHYGEMGGHDDSVAFFSDSKYSDNIVSALLGFMTSQPEAFHYDYDHSERPIRAAVQKSWHVPATAISPARDIPLGSFSIHLNQNAVRQRDRIGYTHYERVKPDTPEWEDAIRAMSDCHDIALDEAAPDDERLKAAFGTYYIMSHLLQYSRGTGTAARFALDHLLHAMELELPPQNVGIDLNIWALGLPFDEFYKRCLQGHLLDQRLSPAMIDDRLAYMAGLDAEQPHRRF